MSSSRGKVLVANIIQKGLEFDSLDSWVLLQLAIMAAVSMTVFFRTKLHQETVADGTIYLGSLFFTVVCIMFNGFGELSMTIFRLPVFFKQRDLLFYPAWAFSLPSFVLSIPMSALESSIWTFMTYYVTGYAPEASRYRAPPKMTSFQIH
jgi:hypothetical protein